MTLTSTIHVSNLNLLFWGEVDACLDDVVKQYNLHQGNQTVQCAQGKQPVQWAPRLTNSTICTKVNKQYNVHQGE